jgi:hypothetical protein
MKNYILSILLVALPSGIIGFYLYALSIHSEGFSMWLGFILAPWCFVEYKFGVSNYFISPIIQVVYWSIIFIAFKTVKKLNVKNT